MQWNYRETCAHLQDSRPPFWTKICISSTAAYWNTIGKIDAIMFCLCPVIQFQVKLFYFVALLSIISRSTSVCTNLLHHKVNCQFDCRCHVHIQNSTNVSKLGKCVFKCFTHVKNRTFDTILYNLKYSACSSKAMGGYMVNSFWVFVKMTNPDRWK